MADFSPMLEDLSPTLADFSPIPIRCRIYLLYTPQPTFSSPLGFILRSREILSAEEKYDRRRATRQHRRFVLYFSATVVVQKVFVCSPCGPVHDLGYLPPGGSTDLRAGHLCQERVRHADPKSITNGLLFPLGTRLSSK